MIFFLRRSVASLVQLFVLSVVLFLFFRLLPGDIYTADLGDPQASRQSIEALREAAGLKNSWPHRYFDWAASCVKGDFGTSLAYGLPVIRLIAPRMKRTLAIALPALVLAWLLGMGFPRFVLAEVTLSFLGLGVGEPEPSWGGVDSRPETGLPAKRTMVAFLTSLSDDSTFLELRDCGEAIPGLMI